MSISKLRGRLTFAAIPALFLFPLAAAAQVIRPPQVNIIYACANNTTGDARIVASKANCTATETFFAWNVVGIQGPAGPAGAQGRRDRRGLRGWA